jgi:chemotaxis protein MotB
MARRREDDAPIETGRWLATYADIMNNLLVLFILLYSMSIMDLEKFKVFAEQFAHTLSGTAPPTSAVELDGQQAPPPSLPEDSEIIESFDELYEKVKAGLAERGYDTSVVIQKENGYIHIRFLENVLFYPDSPVMKEDGTPVLEYVGHTIRSADYLIQSIEISGHTARVGEDSATNFFAWELSSDRAVTVLKFLVQRCDLPQPKMTVSGFAHFRPVSDDSTEEGRASNRRVEIRITRLNTDVE